ncbi:hypothetical protein [Methanobrevibacter sp.]|uniref:hypothetical protein n=1 Tax=Methanobrevibacter sp. TaxID=66852 RepID=UPI00386FC092
MVIYKLNITDGEIMNSIFVVVHVNEAEEFLEDYLESIKLSDFKDMEVLCVVDNTEEELMDIVIGFSKRDSRISIITKEEYENTELNNYEISKLINDNKELNSQVDRLLVDNEINKQEFLDYKVMHKQVLKSKSWKITKPLRKLNKIFKN